MYPPWRVEAANRIVPRSSHRTDGQGGVNVPRGNDRSGLGSPCLSLLERCKYLHRHCDAISFRTHEAIGDGSKRVVTFSSITGRPIRHGTGLGDGVVMENK